MKIDSETLNMGPNIKNAQTVKNCLLNKMLEEGDISNDLAKKWSEEYQVVIIKPSWWVGWKKLFGEDNGDNYIYKMIKIK